MRKLLPIGRSFHAILVGLVLASACLVAAMRPASAAPAIVFEQETGVVLYSEAPDYLWHPASLTKLMTAYLTFEAIAAGRLNGDTKLRTSVLANSQQPTKIGLRVGGQMTVLRALKTLIVRSANDVAVLLAEGVGRDMARYSKDGRCIIRPLEVVRKFSANRCKAGGRPGTRCRSRRLFVNDLRQSQRLHRSPPPGTHPRYRWIRTDGSDAGKYRAVVRRFRSCHHDAFVQHMNLTAVRLGMTRTRFQNPNGLPDDRQVTTARDLALLTRAIIKTYPEHKKLFAMESVRVGKRSLNSYNGLLHSLDGADGMKTGFICASGFNIVASATRQGRQLVAVVLGMPTSGLRNARTRKLIEHGFAYIDWKLALGEPTIDALAMAPGDVQGPDNIKRRVRSYVCGNGRRHRTVRRKAKRSKSAKKIASSTKRRKKNRSE